MYPKIWKVWLYTSQVAIISIIVLITTPDCEPCPFLDMSDIDPKFCLSLVKLISYPNNHGEVTCMKFTHIGAELGTTFHSSKRL